ncbi:PREDICTED: uncharacterized protein LOC107335850 isoform X1 [Acropora digitifera]|uniref:uncharacterized protein LOC107335850 isoform X1 n=1 Tax=Acropora digitifera TaxID=70779 RepID=UPI00077A366D|nr:PREDICTED: uncharacterized protein LOC107335850 isoform X1 [Acropora digitifera]
MAFDSFHNESKLNDFNSTRFASQVITSSFSILCYVVVFVLSVLSVCFKSIRKFLASPARHIFFLIAGILTSVAVLNTRHGKPDVIRDYHVTVSAFLVGVVLVLLGAVLFFEKPRSRSEYQATLGKHQPSMGLLLTIITLPLCAIGLLILIEEQASKGETWLVLVVNQAVFILQKVIQAAVYVWLRDFRVRESCRENARFYFEVLAFFNFNDWLNTQATLNTSFDVEQAKNFYGEWFGFLFRIYKALLIDYRLLCSLLFLEHAIQVQNETADAEMIDGGSGRIEISSTPINRQNRNIGFVVGFCCLLIPLICALHYFRKLHVAVITRAVATLLGALIILASGGALLRKNRFDYDIRHTESKAVKIMVCFFAAAGFSSLMIKAALAVYWAHIESAWHKFRWAGAELVMRGLTTLFLMYLFLKVNPRALHLRNPQVKINHFLVPVLMFGITANFVACLVDQQIGPLDQILREQMHGADQTSLLLLNEIGSTMLLGFLIHVGLTFLVMQTSFNRCPHSHSGEEFSPLVL